MESRILLLSFTLYLNSRKLHFETVFKCCFYPSHFNFSPFLTYLLYHDHILPLGGRGREGGRQGACPEYFAFLNWDPDHFTPLLKTLQCLPCPRPLRPAGAALGSLNSNQGSLNSNQSSPTIPGRCLGSPVKPPFLLFPVTQISPPLQGSNQMSPPPADV